MNKSFFTLLSFSASFLAICSSARSMTGSAHYVVGSDSGTATFLSSTNVPGIEIKGTSNALISRAEVTATDAGLVIQKVDAVVPVKSLATGMKMRDEHMRRYIFELPGGQTPDLQFSADNANCPSAGASQGYACRVSGTLSIRGVSRPFAINVRVKEQRSGASGFHVAGTGVVKLSDYGIARPSQFGVQSIDEVEIHLDFTGKEKPGDKVDGGGQ